MSTEGYLIAIEPAIRHMFAALAEYDAMPLPDIFDYVDEDGHVRMTPAENQEYMKQVIEYMELDEARAITCGSILQVAFSAIRLHSKNQTLSQSAIDIGITKGHAAEPFCIGRIVHSIPIGLLIYAGRIQYNHWQEGEPWNKVAREVLRRLYMVHYQNPLFDLAYDLEFPSPHPVSHYIVRLELKWNGFEDFDADLRQMLL